MWPVDRREEFQLLESLLNECMQINSSSHIIGRLAKITELANVLKKTNLEKPRESFFQFLIGEAMKR